MRHVIYVMGMVMGVGGWLMGEVSRVEVARDTWVSSVGSEQVGNNGGGSRLKLKGIQEFALIDIDAKGLVGRVIRRATLHLNLASPKEALGRITVSTLAGEWEEGRGTNYAAEKGSVSFMWARNEEKAWAYTGSDITAVCNGLGNTIWGFADATGPDREGWQTIAVSPEVMAARVAGISGGFVVFDDVGSEYDRAGERFTYRLFPNRYVYSREQNRRVSPYFTVEFGAEDRESPGGVEGLRSTSEGVGAGEAKVSWGTPRDRGEGGVIGFLVGLSEGTGFEWDRARRVPQYLVPMAGEAGSRVTMHLRELGLKAGAAVTVGIRAVDRAGNVGPVVSGRVELAGERAKVELRGNPARAFGEGGAVPTVGGVEVAVIDGLDKVHPITGRMIPEHGPGYLRRNHLWSAGSKTIRLYAARNEFVDFQVVLTGKTEGLEVGLVMEDGLMRGELLRFRHVKTKAGPLPDPLVGVEGVIAIPAADDGIEGQRHATLLGEVYVPHDARPGLHRGVLRLKNGGEMLELGVELRVWDFVLPDHLSFIPEMNCYGLPGGGVEKAYYRLAHAHRTCLNRLGYSWRGTISEGCGPRVKGVEWDWGEYDRRFGPLLDGTAFADLPRKGVAVEAFYLPLNENWPVDVNRHFKGGYWIESAFEGGYREGFVEACARFAEHIKEKKWNGTLFEFYMNNKVYHKGSTWGGSSAPWIFDEPVNTQDFWALRWYGMAFHEGVGRHAGEAKLVFRCDISRPQWQRDILDGVLDVNIVGGDFRRYQRVVMDRKVGNGEMVINYGSSNNIEDSNVQGAAWCLDTWCLGGDGVLPWQTVGNEKSWKEGDQLSLFYPTREGAAPSVRLKSYRRGQQDVEYLTILAVAGKFGRGAVTEAVGDALRLLGRTERKNEEDAGLVSYGPLDPGMLWELRMRVGATLDGMRPAGRARYVELGTARRDVRGMRPKGHIVGSGKAGG